MGNTPTQFLKPQGIPLMAYLLSIDELPAKSHYCKDYKAI